MESENLATELLREVKASAKRWFIVAIVELAIIVVIVCGFLWYTSLPTEDYSVDISNDGGNANYVGRDLNGGIFNGEDNGTADEEGSSGTE